MYTIAINFERHGRACVTRIAEPSLHTLVETDEAKWSYALSFRLCPSQGSAGTGQPRVVVDLEVETGAISIGCMAADLTSYVDRELYVPSGMRGRVYVPIGEPGAASYLMFRNASADGRSSVRIHGIEIRRVAASEEIQERLRSLGAIGRVGANRRPKVRALGPRVGPNTLDQQAPPTRALASTSSRFPLLGLRLVATLPPEHFFGGNNLQTAREQIEALRNLGAVVYEFDTAAIYSNDWFRIDQQQRAIVEFRPDAAISTPHAGYLIEEYFDPKLPRTSARNFFIEELELPVVLFWDHAITQAARYLLRPWPNRPCESEVGARQRLRNLFTHPNIVHFFPDSGQAEELGRLEIGSFNDDSWYVQAMGKAFAESGSRAEDGEHFDEEVAFFGNIYLSASDRIPYAADPVLAWVRNQARGSCAADWRLSAWHAYLQSISALEPHEKAALRLVPDQSFFWRFLHDELSYFKNGEDRLRILQLCGKEIAFFGNFNDSNSNALMPRKFRLRGVLPYSSALADAFRRTRVTIDVANAAFINGFSVKLMVCFAAGGLALTNRKTDIARAIGPLADEICYKDADDLAGKLDVFLGNDGKRREVSRAIGAIMRRAYSAEALFARTLPLALERIKKH